MRSACRLEGIKSLQLSTSRHQSVLVEMHQLWVKRSESAAYSITVRVSNTHAVTNKLWAATLSGQSSMCWITLKLRDHETSVLAIKPPEDELIFTHTHAHTHTHTHTHTAELWCVCLWVCSSCQLSLCLPDILLVTHTTLPDHPVLYWFIGFYLLTSFHLHFFIF